tara:strand:+ start:90 stop:620 length:531 start_codon:yes stop_codon:yes gene_type:complete
MTIFLVGYMGAGKSVIGKSLSNYLDYDFFDLDEYIEKIEGRKISDIFKKNNEVYFRNIENKCLIELSKKSGDKIISTGGGTPCFENNFKILNETPNSKSIYLKTSINNLVERLYQKKHIRPLISHIKSKEKLKEFIGKHLFERSFYYEKSNIIIETSDNNIEAIRDSIINALTKID